MHARVAFRSHYSEQPDVDVSVLILSHGQVSQIPASNVSAKLLARVRRYAVWSEALKSRRVPPNCHTLISLNYHSKLKDYCKRTHL